MLRFLGKDFLSPRAALAIAVSGDYARGGTAFGSFIVHSGPLIALYNHTVDDVLVFVMWAPMPFGATRCVLITPVRISPSFHVRKDLVHPDTIYNFACTLGVLYIPNSSLSTNDYCMREVVKQLANLDMHRFAWPELEACGAFALQEGDFVAGGSFLMDYLATDWCIAWKDYPRLPQSLCDSIQEKAKDHFGPSLFRISKPNNVAVSMAPNSRNKFNLIP